MLDFFTTSLGTKTALTQTTWYFPLSTEDSSGSRPNLRKEAQKELEKVGIEDPQEVFHYVYGLGYAGGLEGSEGGDKIKVSLLGDRGCVDQLKELGKKLFCVHFVNSEFQPEVLSAEPLIFQIAHYLINNHVFVIEF